MSLAFSHHPSSLDEVINSDLYPRGEMQGQLKRVSNFTWIQRDDNGQ